MIWASFTGSEIALTYLLAQPDIDVNATNDDLETALHLSLTASGQRQSSIIKRLLIKGADMSMVNKKDRTVLDVCRLRIAKKPHLKESLSTLERADPKLKTLSQKFKELLLL